MRRLLQDDEAKYPANATPPVPSLPLLSNFEGEQMPDLATNILLSVAAFCRCFDLTRGFAFSAVAGTVRSYCGFSRLGGAGIA